MASNTEVLALVYAAQVACTCVKGVSDSWCPPCVASFDLHELGYDSTPDGLRTLRRKLETL